MNKIKTRSGTTSGWLLALFFVPVFFSACRKMNQELAQRQAESGIVRVTILSQQISAAGASQAHIGDTVDVVCKIGLPDAPMTLSLGSRSLDIITNTPGTDTLVDGYTTKVTGYIAVRHLKVRIPPDFAIGNTYFSLVVDGLRKPALSFNIVKPILLYPGKVGVTAAMVTPQLMAPLGFQTIYYNPFILVDGPLGQATSSKVIDVAVDKDTRTLYFLDQIATDTSDSYNSDRTATIFLRKLENGVVTTLGGNGADPNATNIANKKFSNVNGMRIGPDSKLYLSLVDKIPPSDQGTRYGTVLHAQIVRLDPATGELQNLIGYKTKADTLGAIQGFSDGKCDTARIFAPGPLSFDAQGNLYFLDGTTANGTNCALVRKLGTDSTLTTIMGQFTLTTKRVFLTDATRPYILSYALVNSGDHVDGFYGEARLGNASGLAVAGNGKLYILENGGGAWGQTFRELNPDTRELSTIAGLAPGITTGMWTGTFKEVDFSQVSLSTIDADYDGNILYGTNNYGNDGRIYKMDLNTETISQIAGGAQVDKDNNLSTPVPGLDAHFFVVHRIVFDLAGQLYVADDQGGGGVTIKKITLER